MRSQGKPDEGRKAPLRLEGPGLRKQPRKHHKRERPHNWEKTRKANILRVSLLDVLQHWL